VIARSVVLLEGLLAPGLRRSSTSPRNRDVAVNRRRHDGTVRTTIDLPDDLHERVRHLAHLHRRSMSEVVANLVRVGLRQPDAEPPVGPRGMPRRSVGRPITADDLRFSDDED